MYYIDKNCKFLPVSLLGYGFIGSNSEFSMWGAYFILVIFIIFFILNPHDDSPLKISYQKTAHHS